jgi:hypothetical protein
MGRWSFPDVAISNPNLLSNSETGVKSSNKKVKTEKHLSECARCQKAIGCIYFEIKWKVETLQPVLEFDNFKPMLKSGLFNCISWMDVSFLGDDDRGFLKEGIKTYLMAPMSPLNLPIIFRLHTYFLCSSESPNMNRHVHSRLLEVIIM